jgi:uncharacterized protein (TIGR03083 family)
MTADVAPRSRRRTMRPGLDHAWAMRLAATEYARVVATLEQLGPHDWAQPTDCPGWDVRAVAGHILGMARFASSLRQQARQQAVSARRAGRKGIASIDALTALQVEEHAALTTSELVEQLRTVGPRAVRGRSRVPGVLRSRITIPEETDGVAERWTLSFLYDTILTRDPFMHRLDIARATGVLVPPTADHEGVVVADVVAEWAARHGHPFVLELTGEAGGHWDQGDGGEHICMDAFDFCRVLSGRGDGPGLLTWHVPF